MKKQNKNPKTELLTSARKAIQAKLENKSLEIPEKIKKQFSAKQACFITLTKHKELRGCIGSLIPRQELWKDVIENAQNAAFSDPRFPELTKDELKDIKIEISLLTIPKQISYSNPKELLKKIKSKGVIISYGFNQATYLPQVWTQIRNPEQFLSSLCQKAGLPSDFWKTGKLKIQVYDVKKVEEN